MKRMVRTTFARDESGANAVEFGLVAFPFFLMIFGLIGIAFNFFIQNSLENGMSRTSRLIRTGEAQANNWTLQDFKNNVCISSGQNKWIDCQQLQIFVQTTPTWADVQPTPCVTNGNVNVNNTPLSTPIANLAGGASAIVIVTACYRWTLPQILPFVNFGNLSDHSAMMQTVTAFRAEPYTPPS